MDEKVKSLHDALKGVTSNYLSKAFTLPRSFLLFLQLMRTCVLFLTDWVRTDRGPVLNSSCSRASISSGVISDRGLFINALQ